MSELTLASFISRVMAFAIDSVLLCVMQTTLFFYVAGMISYDAVGLEPLGLLAYFLSYITIFLLTFGFLHMAYFTIFHTITGQTVGKMIMGLKVIAQDTKSIPFSVSFLRWTGYMLSALPLAAGFLWSAVDRDHCAWHDMLAETRVVSTEMT